MEVTKMNFLKKFVFFFDYILPFPLLVIMPYLWYIRVNHNLLFAIYVLALPLLWGYIVPGVGTNVLKLWWFKGKWVVGNYYLHHGIMYAGPLSLLLYVTFGDGPVSTVQSITIILCTGGMQGLLSSQHDILAIKAGTMVMDNPPAREGKSPEEIVNYCSPLAFFLIGGSYGASCVFAYGKLVVEQVHTASMFCFLLLFGVIIMGLIPSIPYLLLNKRDRKKEKINDP
jgi:hypothetical protein